MFRENSRERSDQWIENNIELYKFLIVKIKKLDISTFYSQLFFRSRSRVYIRLIFFYSFLFFLFIIFLSFIHYDLNHSTLNYMRRERDM